jgi:Flp pilus assembly protein TadD
VRALAIDAADAEAAYYLGRALAALGDAVGARQALVQAADAAPASVWRERAERQLALLGF